MEDVENWRDELDIAGLSLVDEDDSLLLPSFPDPTTYEFSDIDKEDGDLSFFGDTHNCDEGKLVSTLEEKEDVLKPPDPHKIIKYNLRKSLAWDRAFFTNAGVLEPDELSSMMESTHVSETKVLPTIQEDVNRSTESISTMQSDCTVETSPDSVLFDDVRASVQCSAATPDKIRELGATEAAPTPTPTLLDELASQGKTKPHDSRKRPSIRAKGLGNVTKQPVTANELSTSISRPLSRLGRTKRATVDVNKAKEEKNPKVTAGNEHLASRAAVSRSSRPTVSKPVVPLTSALRSSVASENELTSSCSSLESCVSSSSASNKSLDSVKQKLAENLRIASHSSANGSTSRAASRNIGQPKVPPLLASRTYKSKLSSNGLRLSASVDWSSSPRPFTSNKVAKGNKKTVPGEPRPAINDTAQTMKPLNNPKGVSAVQDDTKLDQGAKRGCVVSGGMVRSAPMTKPTGLRVPSPKLGCFDGARSSVPRTPRGSCSSPVIGVAKPGARIPNESATASWTKSGKSQDSQPAKSPLPTKSKVKISPVSRSPRLVVTASASSPKLANKMYSKISAEEQLKGNEEDNVAR